MNRPTLIVLIIATLALIGALVAYGITFSSVSKLQEESFLLAQEIEAAVNKEERISRAERTLALINSQESTIYEYLVSQETIVDFLETLEGIEKDTSVEIDILSVAASAEKESFDINLTVEGTFRNVMQTLGAIEKLPVFLRIETGTIETIIREGVAGESIWTASASYSVKQQ